MIEIVPPNDRLAAKTKVNRNNSYETQEQHESNCYQPKLGKASFIFKVAIET